MYLNDMANVLRAAGLKVVEVGGWKSHNHGSMRAVRSIIAHHTAGAATGNYPSLNVVRNGRPRLEGPLAQLGLGRDGTVYVISNGVSWHAGPTINDSVYGNYYAIGIEAENTGVGQAWPAVQVDAYARMIAALCRHYKVPVSAVKGHKEICYPAGRKIDPHGLPGDMNGLRQRVQSILSGNNGGGNTPPARNLAREYGDNMLLVPAGGKSKTELDYVTVPLSILREHDLVLAPGVGAELYIKSINTWKNQFNAQNGADVMNPGGVGAILKDFTVWAPGGKSIIVPKGVAKVDIAFYSRVRWSLAVYPR